MLNDFSYIHSLISLRIILMITTDIFVYLIGAWTIHLVLIICLKILFNIIPGISQETSWTLTNISYMFGSFLMFHWVRGVPFEFNAGAYDNLNMWEQIDNGAQYTPAKKFLLSVPILLFLLSTHYTHYGLTYFTINFLAVLGVVIPKLPYVGSSYNLLIIQVLTDTESSNTGWTLFSLSRRPIVNIHNQTQLYAYLRISNVDRVYKINVLIKRSILCFEIED